MKGFTLLFASLVVAILLSIGLTISNITLAQLTLSSSGRESQFAFYNADTGIECALWYEYNATSTTGGPFFPINSATIPDTDLSKINCAGVSATSTSATQSGATTTIKFDINPSSSCTKGNPSFGVTISNVASTTASSTNVLIESRGYNTCDASSPKRVERGIYVKLFE